MKYDLLFTFKTGDLLPKVREFENEVNGIMADFRFTEKMFLQSTDVPCMTIESDVELPVEDQQKIVAAINEEIEKKGHKLTCTGIRKSSEIA